MKAIVLDHPRLPSKDHFNDIANTPLWSCLMGGYGASALKDAGVDTLFLDHAQPGMTFAQSHEQIQDLDADLLCINSVYFWEHTPRMFAFINDLKKDGFSGHINLFGFFPTLAYRQILQQFDGVDSIAVGEFEHTLADLARALGTNASLNTVEGLAQNVSDTIAFTPRSPEKNPDNFSFPLRNSLDGTVTLLASRGCYNHCSFCPVPSFYNQGPLWRGRSPQNIAREMEQLAAQGVQSFYFADPNFIGPGRAGRERIIELMELIRPLNIRFGMETRPQDLSGPVLDSMVRSGFESLLMGIESGSKHILTGMNKSSSADMGARAIALCREFNIEPEIGFLMFVPDASLDDLKQNFDFLEENRLLDRLERTANLLCHSQIVLAGTSGYAWFEKQHRLKEKGFLDFQASVTFKNHNVEWVAQKVMAACHAVLRSSSAPESPVYWENSCNTTSRQLNQALKDGFLTFLEMAGKQSLDSADDEKADRWISQNIHAVINREVAPA